jgi:hypothetical protein
LHVGVVHLARRGEVPLGLVRDSRQETCQQGLVLS